MVTRKELNRLRELETKAKEDYIKYSEWSAVIAMLDDEEKKEYEHLFNKILGEA